MPFSRGFLVTSNTKRSFICLLFTLPALMIIFIFFLFPMIRSLIYSFTDWDGISQEVRYTGFENFSAVVKDGTFKRVTFNTLYLLVIYVPVLNIIALLLAVGIYNAGKTGNIYKAVLFFPNLLAMTVVGFIWKLILSYRGLLNTILNGIGLEILVRDWLGNINTVLPAMSASIIWFAVGYYLLIYLAGLLAIPIDLYESAEVEGVNPFQKLIYITIPMIAPAITITVILSTIGIITMFDLPFVLTKGGPGYMSETLALHIYYYAFITLQSGYALALAVILGVFAIIITLIQLHFLQKREEIF